MDASFKVSILILVLLLSLSGCSGNEPSLPSAAPVIDGWKEPDLSRYYVVQTGDTVYSIAWAFGLDYKDLVQFNQLNPPYTLRPGSRLKMGPKRDSSSPTPTLLAQKSVKEAKPAPKVLVEEESPSPPSSPSRLSSHSPSVKAPPSPVKTAEAPSRTTSWQWPTSGQLTALYSLKPGQRGIDIRGKLGQPIQAAGNGEVVYSGSGLRGYGQLIIVKHNATYLSAYAYNQVLLVKEGDVVKVGQIIARMGKTDSGEVKLHFEIRKNGQPVDPLAYLPPKK